MASIVVILWALAAPRPGLEIQRLHSSLTGVTSLIGLLVIIAAVVLLVPVLKRGLKGRSLKTPLSTLLRPLNLLAAAMLAFTMGELLMVNRSHPGLPLSWGAPSGFLLAGYPLLLAAVFTLPFIRRGQVAHLRTAIDGLLIMTAATTLSWFFVLGPLVGRHSPFLGLVFPIMDLALLFGLLTLAARSPGETLWPSMPLATGIASLIFGDSLQQYGTLVGSGILRSAGEATHFFGSFLLALAVIGLARSKKSSRTRRESQQSGAGRRNGDAPPLIWNSLLPNALVPATAALGVYAWRMNLPGDIVQGVIAGTIALACIAFVRQILSIREHVLLYGRVNQDYLTSVALSDKMGTLNEELQRTREQLQVNNEALVDANLKLKAQATTDPLTGLPNHRSMVFAIDQELERSERYSRPCTLLFLDLDHFKALNDNCGHLAGDSVLRDLVAPILEGLRSVDIVGRWGGEEFIVVLPETGHVNALAVAERIRDAVAGYRFSMVGGAYLTCSIGLATYPDHAATRDALIEASDRAMYTAKRLGRNQVRMVTDPSVPGFASELRRYGSREEAVLLGVVEALTMMLAARDGTRRGPGDDVDELCIRLAEALQLPASEVRAVGMAARLRDIGTVSIPEVILEKPGSLSETEWRAVRAHAQVGAEILARVPALALFSPLVRSHHERWDGTGYPDGLAVDDIPMGARIIAVSDAFSAITSPRAYRPAGEMDEALQEVKQCAGAQFDPMVVEALDGLMLEEEASVLEAAG